MCVVRLWIMQNRQMHAVCVCCGCSFEGLFFFSFLTEKMSGVKLVCVWHCHAPVPPLPTGCSLFSLFFLPHTTRKLSHILHCLLFSAPFFHYFFFSHHVNETFCRTGKKRTAQVGALRVREKND